MSIDTKPYLFATLYTPPNGTESYVKLYGASQEDRDWFHSNKIILSIEHIPGPRGRECVLYGRWPDQEDEDEALEISQQLPTTETFTSVRKQLESYKS